MLNILLIEKYPIIHAGIEFLLRKHFPGVKMTVVADFQQLDPEQAARQNVVLLGNFLGSDVDERCGLIVKIRQKMPGVPVVLYNYATDYMEALMYFRNGAMGYVMIDSEADQLVDCIKSVLNNKKFISVKELLYVVERLDTKTNESLSRKIPHFKKLTSREYEIAEYITSGIRTGDVAEMLHLRPSTISTVKANIFRKLNVHNIVELSVAIKKVTEDIIKSNTRRREPVSVFR